MKKIVCLVALLWIAFASLPVHAQSTTASNNVAAEKAEKKDKSLLDFYAAGGIWMHPIALCSIVSVGVAVFCFLNIQKSKIVPPALLATLRTHMASRQVGEAYRLCKAESSPLSNVMEDALVKANFEREMYNKNAMEAAAGESLAQEETKLMLMVNYLNVCAQIAPMLGLLGTVVGMIESFEQLASGKAEPSDLANGIGVAMLTTATGLLVAIPSMAIYFYFRTSLIGIMNEMQKQVSNLLDLFTGEMTPEGLRAPTGYTGKVPTTGAE